MGTPVFTRGAMLLVPGIVAILASAPVRAEEPLLSLTRAIELSFQNNGELKSFREEKGIRDAGKVRAGLLPNPTFDLEAGSGAMSGSKDENRLALGLSQEFVLAGKLDKRLSIAECELEIYRWQLADKERLLKVEVKTAFHDVLLAKERVALADRSIDLNRQLLDVAKERLAAGDIPELELNLVRVELARSEGIRIESARTMAQNQSRLWSLMGGPAGNRPEIAGKLETDTTMALPITELKQLASVNRPDIKAIEAEKSRGEADIALALAEKIPNLTTGLIISRDTTTMEIGGIEGKDTAYTIGVRLSMPIPVFDRNQAGIQEATARKTSSGIRLSSASRTLELEVENAYATLQNATSVLALYRTGIIPQLEENLKLTQEAWRLGEIGILNVIQEQKKFFEVSDGYLTALHARQTAMAKLESAIATELSGGVQ